MGNLKKKFTNKKIQDQSRQLVTDWKAACVPAAATPDKSQNGKTPTKKVEEKKVEEKKEVKKEEPAVDKKRKLSSMQFYINCLFFILLVWGSHIFIVFFLFILFF